MLSTEEVALSIYHAEVEQHTKQMIHGGKETKNILGVSTYLDILKKLREDSENWTYTPKKEVQ